MSTGNNTKLYAILAIVVIVAAGSIAAIVLLQGPAPSTGEGIVNIEGSDGSQYSLTMEELLSITPVERFGSYENSYNNTRGSGTYIGAKISDILTYVGGMDSDEALLVNATDGYSQMFTYDNVYPNTTFYDVQGDFVLAYTFNGSTIPDYEDGPRIMFLPEDGYFDNADAAVVIDPEYSAGAAGPKLVSNVQDIIIMAREGEPTEPTILNVIRDDEILSYTLSDLLEMPSVTGSGGYKKSTGTLEGPFTYTGVLVEYLLNQTGNLPVEYTVEVVATDGYTTYYNRTQVEGTFEAYDGTTGDSVGIQEFQFALAYYEGGSPITNGAPLRAVTLNEDGYFSDGHFWAKSVLNVTLIDNVEPWSLELEGVQSWNMTHDTYYALASCSHHRTEVTIGSSTYAGVPLWTLISSCDGGDDTHYTFNTSLAVSGYNVSLFDGDGLFVNFTSAQLAGNASIIVAGWVNGSLLDGDDWPLKLVTPEGNVLGNIVLIEMWNYD